MSRGLWPVAIEADPNAKESKLRLTRIRQLFFPSFLATVILGISRFIG